MKEAEGLGLYLKVGGRLHFVLFHKFICGNFWKKGVRHHDFYSELVLRGVGHGYFYFILAGLLPALVAPHGDRERFLDITGWGDPLMMLEILDSVVGVGFLRFRYGVWL